MLRTLGVAGQPASRALQLCKAPISQAPPQKPALSITGLLSRSHSRQADTAAGMREPSCGSTCRSAQLRSRCSRHHSNWGSLALQGLLVLWLTCFILGPVTASQASANAAGAARAARAAAQSCIECRQCLTDNCQRICQPFCRQRASGGTVLVTGDQCKQKGEEAADGVAGAACKMTQSMCQTGSKSALAFQSSNGPVSTTECSALANGACQRVALSSTNSPCGVQLYFGFRTCSGRQFTDMYRSRVVALCRAATNKGLRKA